MFHRIQSLALATVLLSATTPWCEAQADPRREPDPARKPEQRATAPRPDPVATAALSIPMDGGHRVVLTLPTLHDPKRPIPLVLGLHGFGSVPEDFAGEAGDQELADRLDIAFVSVSASIVHSPQRFAWSEDIERDRAHVYAALELASTHVTWEPGAVLAAGFSQGGQLALELAARDPELFAGAIALCPGGGRGMQLDRIAPRPDLSRECYLIVSGALEREAGRALAGQDRRWLSEAGARTVRHVYPDLGHRFPPLYYDSLSMWIQFLLPPRPARQER